MAHLDVSPLETPPLSSHHHADVSSPDELSMFEVFDEDADGSFLDDAKRGVSYEQFATDSSATLHALEVLASLDDPESNPVNGVSRRTPEEKPRPGPKTKMTAEEKKRRNRDCMRRLRNRRNDLISSMRSEIEALEAHLNRQLDISNERKSEPESTQDPETQNEHDRTLRKLQMDHARIKTAMRRLREENYWLQKEIAQRQESLDAVRQIVQTADDSTPIDVDALEEVDIGRWIRNTDQFVPPLDESRAFEIVMESYRMIQEGVQLTQKLKAAANTVLGWSDQRSVVDHWANFMIQKTFPHENSRVLALKTWKLMSDFAEINVLQPKSHEMKVLQRLNDYTLVVARHTYFEATKFSYCMIYLLFLLETDDGFIVGTRSLDPDENRMQPYMRDREHMVVAKPFHGFHFQKDAVSGGTKVSFAGRVDNSTTRCARNCAMDLLLGAMRWENHCVSPLWRLDS